MIECEPFKAKHKGIGRDVIVLGYSADYFKGYNSDGDPRGVYCDYGSMKMWTQLSDLLLPPDNARYCQKA